ETLLDSAELRLVGLDINVDILQPADVLAVAIDEHLAVPFGDTPRGLVLIFGHIGVLVISRAQLAERVIPSGLGSVHLAGKGRTLAPLCDAAR
ncbi:MAG: hypothetical protein ABSC16_13665, partial [Candidatus Dormibacteria bacterium]